MLSPLGDTVEVFAQSVEPRFPCPGAALGPGAHLPEWCWVQAVDPLLAEGSRSDDTGFAEHPQVPGDRGLADAEELDELADASVVARQGLDDLHPSVFGQCA